MNSLFHSAAVRLTLMYLTIIVGLSAGFSVVMYRISSDELRESLRRPPAIIHMPIGSFDFETFRREQLALSHRRLKARLVVFNLATLVGGGLASYYFARRSLRPIEEALEGQRRFSADASHELRTPLTVMQTEIEVALRDSHLKLPEAKALLKSTLGEVKNLQTLSENLLQLARNDDKSLSFSRVPLSQVVERAWQAVSTKAEAKNIRLEAHIAARHRVWADRSALAQVLTILFDNAIKYSSSDTMVTVTADTIPTASTIIVRDQGMGIDANDLPHIFDRFYRGDKARTKHTTEEESSYGLGLAIAKQLVLKQAGSIHADSPASGGAEFTVTLPRKSGR